MAPLSAACQHSDKNFLELSFFGTGDVKSHYTAGYGGVSYSNDLHLSGHDLGFTIDYKRRVYDDKVFVRLGLGYMNFAISKIDNKTNIGGSSAILNARPISYPSNVNIVYFTTKYSYQNLLIHLAVDRNFRLSPTLSFVSSASYFHAFKIAQNYYIPAESTNYHNHQHGDFGDFFNLELGVSKELGRISVCPELVLPVYTDWHQDAVFKENPAKTQSSWFNGIGFSVRLSYN
jgi:hypothetical protein